MKGARPLFLLLFLFCAGLMAYALYAEHALGLDPCPLCIFQRVAVMAVGITAVIAALLPALRATSVNPVAALQAQ